TVTLETGTLDDGTPVEIITVELGVEAIQSLFNTSVVDPSVTAMIISLSGETMGSLTYVLNPDDNTPYLIESRITLQALDLSPQQFGQGISPNAKIDFTTSMVRSDSYSQVNESFDPAEIPDGITP
ncbi:MAG: hypothetical protein HY866_20995, partial [Chloroflexi bacterium]|nr:hypothetical protein [Chloroflexota bacterium]